mmetsp:Transcript_56397/g.100057  ORF Transcript_56397/g.100057 Transcript_56397/m.100057 type:complete len:224 (+) Transcript_56397:224-895(+)
MVDLALESRHLDRYEFYATHSTGLSKHPQVLALADALAPLALPPLALASCALQVLALGSLRQRYVLGTEGHPLGPPQLLHLRGQRLHCSRPYRLWQTGFSSPGLWHRLLQTWTLAPSFQARLPHSSGHWDPPRARHPLHYSRALHPRARHPSWDVRPPRAQRPSWLQNAGHHSRELHLLSRPGSALLQSVLVQLPVCPPLLPALPSLQAHSLSLPAPPCRSRL